jgi:hypothetical protein
MIAPALIGCKQDQRISLGICRDGLSTERLARPVLARGSAKTTESHDRRDEERHRDQGTDSAIAEAVQVIQTAAAREFGALKMNGIGVER